MSAADLVASTVMDASSALLNDPIKSVYTYVAQLPYLRLALQELREEYELRAVPVVEDVSAVIQVDSGQSEIVYNGVGVPALPSDMVEPSQLWERQRNIDPFIPMSKRDFLPHNLEGNQIGTFTYWVWQGNKIKLLPSNRDNDIKIDYIRELFPSVPDENAQINVVNAQTFLEYRTAALCAEFIERNETSAGALNTMAIMAMDRATGISSKGKQRLQSRRRPFRASYKRRGWT